MSVRRKFKNVVKNYSKCERDAREATSNDKWGASGTLLRELADHCKDLVKYPLVMAIVWKRLDDHGKLWRHVYKSLRLLEYLIKAGPEYVARDVRDNLYAVETLKEFHYIDKNGKDQGTNVRERAKRVLELLSNEDRLAQERERAETSRARFSQGNMALSNTMASSSSHTPYSPSDFGTVQGSRRSDNTNGFSNDAHTRGSTRQQAAEQEAAMLQMALEISQAEAQEGVVNIPSTRDEEEEQMRIALELSMHDQNANVQEVMQDQGHHAHNSSGFNMSTMNDSTFDPWAPQGQQQKQVAFTNSSFQSPDPVADFGFNPPKQSFMPVQVQVRPLTPEAELPESNPFSPQAMARASKKPLSFKKHAKPARQDPFDPFNPSPRQQQQQQQQQQRQQQQNDSGYNPFLS